MKFNHSDLLIELVCAIGLAVAAITGVGIICILLSTAATFLFG